MAIKLYQWDATVTPTLVSPNKYDGSFEIKWYQPGYVSMTEGFAVLFNALNQIDGVGVVVKSNADGVAAVKAYLKPSIDTTKVANIRAKYTADDEFFSLRTDDTAIKDDIASIVAAVETERDTWLDVS